MTLVARFLFFAAVATVAACASPQAVPRPPALRLPDLERHEASGQWGDRILVEGVAIPAAWLIRDTDDGSDAESTKGHGYGLRAAIGNRDQSVGLLYQGFRADGGALDVHTLGLDVDVRTPIEDGTRLFFLRAGAGIGGAWLDAVADDSLGTETTAQLRLGLEFQPTEHFVLGASLGGIVCGHPGETEVYGTFVTIGATLVF